MSRYEQNCFVGGLVRINGDAWLGNLMEGCQVEVDHAPAEWRGNVLRGNKLKFVGEMDRAMRFLASLASSDPQLKAQLRAALNLG